MKTQRPIPDKAQKVKPRDLQVSLHMVFIINSNEGQDCPSSQGGWAAGTFAPLQILRVGEAFRLPPPGEPERLSQMHTAGQVTTSLTIVWGFLSLKVHRCPQSPG